MAGLRKAAILLVLMGPDNAAKVLRQLDESQIEQLTLEIANLGEVKEEEKRQIAQEFQELAKARSFLLAGGVDYAKQLLEKALGPEKAMEIIDKMVSNLQVKPFEFLRRVDPVQLVNFCLLYTSPSPRDLSTSRMPSSA